MPFNILKPLLWLLAVLPPAALMGYIYRQDKVEKEPRKLLAWLFLWGAAAVLPALGVELAGLWAVRQTLGPWPLAASAVGCFVVVGLVEEGFKYLTLRRVTWRHPAFNYRFDAIVYAIFVSMGFALVENILYVAGDGTLRTVLLRAVTAIPAHGAFAIFMGYHYGTARQFFDHAADARDPALRAGLEAMARRHLWWAVMLPTLLHGVYDFCLALNLPLASLVFVGFAAALDVAALRRAQKSERSDALL